MPLTVLDTLRVWRLGVCTVSMITRHNTSLSSRYTRQTAGRPSPTCDQISAHPSFSMRTCHKFFEKGSVTNPFRFRHESKGGECHIDRTLVP